MIIAIDYDDTYTADPAMWDQFIKLANEAGHKVVCVTCRMDPDDKERGPMAWGMPASMRGDTRVKIPGVPVFYTSFSPKRWFMEGHNIKVDVWIDDMPECVKDGR